MGGKFKELGVGLEDLILELGKILLGEEPGLIPAFAHLLKSWVTSDKKTQDVLLLKQFRDLSNGLQACHQDVVRAQATLGKIHGLGLTGLYDIDIKSLQSHPIVTHLGLHHSNGSIRAPGFWIKVDFKLGNGRPV